MAYYANTCGVSQTLDAVLDDAAVGYLRARETARARARARARERERERERERARERERDWVEIRRGCRR